MSEELLHGIISEIKEAQYFTVMVDETADVSNKEELVICIRWVDSKLIAHEEFIGLYPLIRTQATDIVEVIKVYILYHVNLSTTMLKI